MLDTPVPIQTLKLNNIGPGHYLDGRPFREFQVLLAPFPLPRADRVQSFQTLFVSIKWLRPAETKKKKIFAIIYNDVGELLVLRFTTIFVQITAKKVYRI